jgi:hypothetical protein
MAPNQRIPHRLENIRATFTEGSSALESSQKRMLEKHIDLLKQDLASSNLGTTARFTRSRARERLIDIYNEISPEVFVLCILGTSITELGTAKDDGVIQQLSDWWKSHPHPVVLSELTRLLCKNYQIEFLVSRSNESELSSGFEVEGNATSLFGTA